MEALILMEARDALRRGVDLAPEWPRAATAPRDLPGQRLLFPGDETIRHGEK